MVHHGRVHASTSHSGALRRIRRPGTASAPPFDLTYVRTGPRTSTPLLVIPGGPGLASVLPYRGFRRAAAHLGLDVIMVEHRGIGRSRRDIEGTDLPFSAMWITDVLDDLACVLDRERVSDAYVVGSSYGSHLAASFGMRYPERVAGMLLDSTLQGPEDLAVERREIRSRFWTADTEVASLTRTLSDRGIDQRRLLDVVRAAFELGGTRLVLPLLRQRLCTGLSPAWRTLEAYATRDGSLSRIPGIYEFDIAGAIGFRELHYGAPTDGHPLDPALTYAPVAGRFPAFHGTAFDLPTEMAHVDWPMVLIAGRRDLRTPPEIARRVAAQCEGAVLVELDRGHSSLDTHPLAVLHAARRLVDRQHRMLNLEAARLESLPDRGATALLARLLSILT